MKINKTKVELTYRGQKVQGYAWYDRWNENVWAEVSGRIITPVEFKRYCNLDLGNSLKLTYSSLPYVPLSDLIYDDNPWLRVMSKTDKRLWGKMYSIPLRLK